MRLALAAILLLTSCTEEPQCLSMGQIEVTIPQYSMMCYPDGTGESRCNLVLVGVYPYTKTVCDKWSRID